MTRIHDRRLTTAAVLGHLDTLTDSGVLTGLQLHRFRALADLADHHGTIRLDQALAELYPDNHGDPQANFRQLRASLRAAAKAAGVDFALAVDSSRGAAAHRTCWFIGAPATDLSAGHRQYGPDGRCVAILFSPAELAAHDRAVRDSLMADIIARLTGIPTVGEETADAGIAQ